MKRQLQFDSCGGAGKIAACVWEPQGNAVGIVQIIHGIAEHVERYDDFARYLNACGYLVVAEDHMGHGLTADLGGTKGYFHGGWWAAVDDVCTLTKIAKEQYSNLPYILFGHSMGSFMARSILIKYPDMGIDGCVICGTGWQPTAVLGAGKFLASTICKVVEPTKPSRMLHSIAFGAYNRRIKQPRTPFDWLTSETHIVDAYAADPKCGFVASASLMLDMFKGIECIQEQTGLARMKKSLPVYFIAGGDDPVGDYGKGVQRTAQAFEKIGMQHVSMKIYPSGRHEILNERNKNEVYADVSDWIENVINSTK